MQTVNKGGDVLARGNTSCQFPPAGGEVTQEKWDAMWQNEDGTKFDPEAYKKDKPVEKKKKKITS